MSKLTGVLWFTGATLWSCCFSSSMLEKFSLLFLIECRTIRFSSGRSSFSSLSTLCWTCVASELLIFVSRFSKLAVSSVRFEAKWLLRSSTLVSSAFSRKPIKAIQTNQNILGTYRFRCTLVDRWFQKSQAWCLQCCSIFRSAVRSCQRF